MREIIHSTNDSSIPEVQLGSSPRLERAYLGPLDECFKRERWKEFCFFARIKPDKTLLPVRKMYNGITENVGNNYLSSESDIWVTGLDLIAAKIRTGKIPRILEAVRIVPVGKQKGMHSIKLRGMIDIDPYTDDLFKKVIELRKQNSSNEALAYWLKIFANAMYGFFAETNPEEVHPVGVKVFKGKDKSYFHEPEREPGCKTVIIDKEGPWYAPYLASLITGGGRLLLSMIEESVTQAGGTYLYADTDALGICASERGGSFDHVPGCEKNNVRALSFDQVDEIVARFDDVNPYDPKAVPHLLSLTGDNWTDKTKTKRRHLLGLSISAKRYALYERNGNKITIVNAKAHGLGHIYPPAESPAGWDDEHEIPKWIFDGWEWMIRKQLNLKQINLPWLGLPLMMREAVTTNNLLQQLHTWRKFRPFNFFMRPILLTSMHRNDTSLVCPSESNPSKWIDSVCTNVSNPIDKTEYQISTDEMEVAKDPWRYCLVKSFEKMLNEYIQHPEAKALGPDGQRCTGTTVGLLERDHVIAGKIVRTSKECPRGLEEGDEPSEVMDFEATIYHEKKPAKPNMVQPTIGHVNQLRKLGYPALVQVGCCNDFLVKIRKRYFMSRAALWDFERAVRECNKGENKMVGGSSGARGKI